MKLLFVCIENSCRSQIAEAFARIHGGDAVSAASAGSRPSGVVNPSAIMSMKQVGYDLSAHHSKSLQDIGGDRFDYVVTMGCGDECPWVPATHREDWEIPDPKNMAPEDFSKVRDRIEEKVRELLARASA